MDKCFYVVIVTDQSVFCSTVITTRLKKSLSQLISQPEKDRVSDMLINMLSWNVSVTHDTMRDLDDPHWYKKLQNYKY